MFISISHRYMFANYTELIFNACFDNDSNNVADKFRTKAIVNEVNYI